ncbi:MAG: polysaccharide deacetylase family protein [Alphaproteobacteria bacterium]|nr:polysaccharide deacetylase family protein [Alphaproteobacteria bacterium]
MPKAYLTIDDGPSEHFRDLVDFLYNRKIPAVFFNRGNHMEQRPDDVIYGIKKGFIMANHTYSHPRASQISLQDFKDDVLKTDAILEKLYQQAGVQRPGKYFRFPHMDRGMGTAFVEPQGLCAIYKKAHDHFLTVGLNHELGDINAQMVQRKRDIQKFLKAQGFESLPVKNVNIDWYSNTEMAEAIDSLCTCSTEDWGFLERHRERKGLKSVEDLKRRIDENPYLHDEGSHHIILAHDMPEKPAHEATIALVSYMTEKKGFVFLPIEPAPKSPVAAPELFQP